MRTRVMLKISIPFRSPYYGTRRNGASVVLKWEKQETIAN